mmetsp:Transcript_40959/g.92366  ORF Transcript_40959/g.92366 Transcript_40959/m.92366 type:complete len:302 (-) Transcript_40959:424-1329(-)
MVTVFLLVLLILIISLDLLRHLHLHFQHLSTFHPFRLPQSSLNSRLGAALVHTLEVLLAHRGMDGHRVVHLDFNGCNGALQTAGLKLPGPGHLHLTADVPSSRQHLLLQHRPHSVRHSNMVFNRQGLEGPRLHSAQPHLQLTTDGGEARTALNSAVVSARQPECAHSTAFVLVHPSHGEARVSRLPVHAAGLRGMVDVILVIVVFIIVVVALIVTVKTPVIPLLFTVVITTVVTVLRILFIVVVGFLLVIIVIITIIARTVRLLTLDLRSRQTFRPTHHPAFENVHESRGVHTTRGIHPDA